MELDDVDREILEAARNEEPFHILCAPPWIKQFQNPREGVERIYRLFQQGLLACRRDSDSKWLQPGELSVDELVANAVQNQWYRDIAEIGWPNEGETWALKTTKEGFKLIDAGL